MKKNIPKVVAEGIRLEKEKVKDDIVAMVVEVARKEQERTGVKISLQVSNDVEARSRVQDLTSGEIVRNHEDHHDGDARSKGESNAKIQKTTEHGTYTRGESSSSQTMDESTPSSSGTQEQVEEFDAWTNDQGTYDDEVPSKEVSPELLAELLEKGMTYGDLKRMQDALNDMMRSLCDSDK
ncbi:hypothetical protein Tco_0580858 [Tanacetum coccineum]